MNQSINAAQVLTVKEGPRSASLGNSAVSISSARRGGVRTALSVCRYAGQCRMRSASILRTLSERCRVSIHAVRSFEHGLDRQHDLIARNTEDERGLRDRTCARINMVIGGGNSSHARKRLTRNSTLANTTSRRPPTIQTRRKLG